MKKILSLLFLVAVTAVMGLKLYFLSNESYDVSLGFFVSFLMIASLWLFSVINIYIDFFKEEVKEFVYKDELFKFSLIFTSALIVYVLHSEFNINSVLVVASLTLLGGLFIKKFDKEVTIGAFIGMGSFLISGYGGVVIASVIAGIVNFMLKDHLNGIGGKLGMIAFSGGLLTYVIFKESFVSFNSYEPNDLIYILIVSIVSALITYILNNSLNLGPVISYSIVSLLGVLFLLFPLTKALSLTTIVFGSSFIGMSSKSQVKSYFIIITAAFVFGVFSFIGQSFTNLGGRGGTMAIISVLVAINFKDIFIYDNKKELKEMI